MTANGNLLGCNGGYGDLVYEFAKNRSGVTSAANNPYVAKTIGKTCNLSKPRTAKSAVRTWSSVPSFNEQKMKEVLFNHGPLHVTFFVANNFYNYKTGIYSDSGRLCPKYSINHSMLLVGYGTENGVDYWIIKNSWGN